MVPFARASLLALLGATGVAVWFLIVDTIAGQPFFTPRVLGEAVKSIVAPDNFASPFRHRCAVYSLPLRGVHPRRHSDHRARPRIGAHIGLLAGMVMLFVALEVLFYGFVLVLQMATPLEGIAWYQVGAANLVAAGLMGRYLWMRHPELTHRLDESLSGRQ